MAALEDAGFFCVDNLPAELLPKFLELPLQQEADIYGLGFVMDLREKRFLSAYPQIVSELRQKSYSFEILFLEADENILLKRYSETRRYHPLAQDKPLLEGIREEKKLMEPLKASATRTIDTSTYSSHDLKTAIFEIARSSLKAVPMQIHVMSFGYKHGIPGDTDLMMDVRFLANPFFVPELKAKNGREEAVKHFVANNPVTREFISRFHGLIDFLLPLYEKEGKAYLTIAIGCTGGQHRSVVIAEILNDHIRRPGRPITLTHRDIDIQT
jgi:UPF0042 nucleotide-binding protein